SLFTPLQTQRFVTASPLLGIEIRRHGSGATTAERRLALRRPVIPPRLCHGLGNDEVAQLSDPTDLCGRLRRDRLGNGNGGGFVGHRRRVALYGRSLAQKPQCPSRTSNTKPCGQRSRKHCTIFACAAFPCCCHQGCNQSRRASDGMMGKG